ncbi:MAG: hypothetical protein AMXMBFR59_32970 [Rhodanobacteraceae bacterium]
MSAPGEPQRRSAWREPMLWLVAGLPAVSVAAGIALIVWIARGNLDALSTDVRRTAQIQAEDTRPDEEALRRGLRATVQRDASPAGLRVELHGDAGDTAGLRLNLLHPTSAAQDRELKLERVDAQHWRAAEMPAASNAWHLRLESADGGWRLAGRLEAAADRAALEPVWRR